MRERYLAELQNRKVEILRLFNYFLAQSVTDHNIFKNKDKLAQAVAARNSLSDRINNMRPKETLGDNPSGWIYEELNGLLNAWDNTRNRTTLVLNLFQIYRCIHNIQGRVATNDINLNKLDLFLTELQKQKPLNEKTHYEELFRPIGALFTLTEIQEAELCIWDKPARIAKLRADISAIQANEVFVGLQQQINANGITLETERKALIALFPDDNNEKLPAEIKQIKALQSKERTEQEDAELEGLYPLAITSRNIDDLETSLALDSTVDKEEIAKRSDAIRSALAERTRLLAEINEYQQHSGLLDLHKDLNFLLMQVNTPTVEPASVNLSALPPQEIKVAPPAQAAAPRKLLALNPIEEWLKVAELETKESKNTDVQVSPARQTRALKKSAPGKLDAEVEKLLAETESKVAMMAAPVAVSVEPAPAGAAVEPAVALEPALAAVSVEPAPAVAAAEPAVALEPAPAVAAAESAVAVEPVPAAISINVAEPAPITIAPPQNTADLATTVAAVEHAPVAAIVELKPAAAAPVAENASVEPPIVTKPPKRRRAPSPEPEYNILFDLVKPRLRELSLTIVEGSEPCQLDSKEQPEPDNNSAPSAANPTSAPQPTRDNNTDTPPVVSTIPARPAPAPAPAPTPAPTFSQRHPGWARAGRILFNAVLGTIAGGILYFAAPAIALSGVIVGIGAALGGIISLVRECFRSEPNTARVAPTSTAPIVQNNLDTQNDAANTSKDAQPKPATQLQLSEIPQPEIKQEIKATDEDVFAALKELIYPEKIEDRARMLQFWDGIPSKNKERVLFGQVSYRIPAPLQLFYESLRSGNCTLDFIKNTTPTPTKGCMSGFFKEPSMEQLIQNQQFEQALYKLIQLPNNEARLSGMKELLDAIKQTNNYKRNYQYFELPRTLSRS